MLSFISFSAAVDKFKNDKRGNIAMMFALISLPFMAVLALSVDANSVSSARFRAQTSLDAALLAVASDLSNGVIERDQATTELNNFLTANVTPLRRIDSFTGTVNFIGDEIVATLDGDFETILGGFVDKEIVPFSMESRATVATATAEIVLVLDTSRSMSADLPPEDDGTVFTRIESLKNAAGLMIGETIVDGNSDAKMGIVPFTHHVNLGTGVRNEGWITVGADRTETTENPGGETCKTTNAARRDAGCERNPYTCYRDGVAQTCYRWENCDSDPVPVCTTNPPSTSTKNYTFHGCVDTRPMPDRFNATNWNVTQVRGQIATNGNACAKDSVLDLTSTVADLEAKVNGLRTSGDTYMAPALMWGLRMLTNDPNTTLEPFNSAADFDEFALINGRKAIVLMSDGHNTRSPGKPTWNSTVHRGNWQREEDFADENTLAACDTIKGQGVEIYAIAFGVDDEDTRALLETCATSVEYYYRAENAVQLATAFSNIGGNFREVRLSQ
ncbi:MAG: pilus assembly protein [Pseudomonadota bacterium]